MFNKKFSLQSYKSGGVMIMNAMAGRAGFLVRIRGSFSPLPTAFMKYCAALGTNGRLRQLVVCLVGIVNTLLQKAVVAKNLSETRGDGPALRTHDETPTVGNTRFI